MKLMSLAGGAIQDYGKVAKFGMSLNPGKGHALQDTLMSKFTNACTNELGNMDGKDLIAMAVKYGVQSGFNPVVMAGNFAKDMAIKAIFTPSKQNDQKATNAAEGLLHEKKGLSKQLDPLYQADLANQASAISKIAPPTPKF